MKLIQEGPRNAKIMIVGEAPAKNEVAQGRPFVGDAGKELDKLLKDAGIYRPDLFITNTVHEPVIGDKEKFFFQGGQPTPAFFAGIRQLYEDIYDIRPNVVVTMGNYAMYALTGNPKGIMNWRGSILWSPTANVKVISTIHPSALLRGKPDDEAEKKGKGKGGIYKFRNPVIWDLGRAKDQSLFPEYRPRPRELVINPSGDDYHSAVERLMSAKRIVYDIESWGGTNLACIGFSDGDPEWAVTWSFDRRRDRYDLFKLLLESDIPKYGQNLMYDCTMLDQNGIFARNVVYDTMIAQHALLPDLPKTLAFMNSIYTDIPYFKDEGKVWKKPRTPELEMQYYLYNAKDVCATAETAIKQQAELNDEDLDKVFRRSMKVFGPLRNATFFGFRADLDKMWMLTDRTQKKLISAQEEVNKIAGWDVNVNSHVQVKKLLYGQLNLSPNKNQSSGAPVILNLAAQTGNKAPYAIVAAREESKLLSNYYKAGLVSRDGRFRFGFNVVGTFGARISSSAPLWGPGLNGQNLPHEARQMFIADDGYTLVEFDQAQAEAVIVAYLANDPVHMDCFRTGKDVHRVTACLLLDKPGDQWKTIPKPSAIRELAKTCNHELNYNAGPKQFQMTVNEKYDPDDKETVMIDFATAQVTRRKYLDTRPALPAYWDAIKAELKLNRTLYTPLGRKYQFLDQWSDSLLNKAYSYKPQCTVGETTNIGICQVLGLDSLMDDEWNRYVCQQEIARLDFQFLLQVHDSTVWQVRDEHLDTFIPLAMRLLEVPLLVNGYNICVPIEGMAGKRWYKKDMRDIGISRQSVEIGTQNLRV